MRKPKHSPEKTNDLDREPEKPASKAKPAPKPPSRGQRKRASGRGGRGR